MAILITGAAGFIGSHLAKRLLRDGQELVLIDRFSDYYSVQMKRMRVESLIPNHGFIELDLADLRNLGALDHLNITSVIHLAAQPGVRLKFPQTNTYLSDNVIAFSNLLLWALKSNIEQFTYASSSSVYGNSKVFPLEETYSPVQPFGPYPVSKHLNETMAKTYALGSNTNTTGLRFFSIYGPWGRPDMAYFRLLTSGLSDYEFQLNGNRNIERDFTYIDDAVESIVRLHFSQKPLGDIYNIGGGNTRSMQDLISISQQITGNRVKLELRGDDPLDSIRTDASSNKLFNEINFKPSIALEVGLQSTYDWAQDSVIKGLLHSWVSSIRN